MAQKPSKGRIVLVGVQEDPAVVTRVWAVDEVNVMVLPDGGAPYCLESVVLHDKRPDGLADVEGQQHHAWWPPRT